MTAVARDGRRLLYQVAGRAGPGLLGQLRRYDEMVAAVQKVSLSAVAADESWQTELESRQVWGRFVESRGR